MNKKLTLGSIALLGIIAGCATMSDSKVGERALDIMKSSFTEKGQAKLDRLNQDDVQRVCSRSPAEGRRAGSPLPP